MTIRKMSFPSVLIFFLGIAPAFADSPVWRVTKGDHVLFIGGTVHLLTQADYPLPDAFEQAYLAGIKRADEIRRRKGAAG